MPKMQLECACGKHRALSGMLHGAAPSAKPKGFDAKDKGTLRDDGRQPVSAGDGDGDLSSNGTRGDNPVVNQWWKYVEIAHFLPAW